MARTQVRTQQVEDGGIQRADLNTVTPGSAVIAKAVAGSGISLASTGADTGTGDVTIGLENVVVAGTKPKVTYDIYGRVTAGANLDSSDIPAGSTQYVQNQTASAQATTNFWISGWGGANEHRAYNGAYFVSFRAPAALTNNYSFSLPGDYGTSGYTLFGDGSGNLTWGNTTSALLTGLATGTNSTILATDTILGAFAKLQAQISAGGGGGGGTNYWGKTGSTVTLATTTDSVDLGSPTTARKGKLNLEGGSVTVQSAASVRALLHFDGPNGSKRFADAGSYSSRVYSRWTNYYNQPVLSSTQKVFGNSSLYLDGTTFLEVACPYAIGTGDFTVDFQVYFNVLTGTQTIMDFGGVTNGLVVDYSAGTWSVTIVGTVCTFSFTPTASTWYHIAISRTSGSVRMWVAGAKTGSTQTAASSLSLTPNLFIGATSAGTNKLSAYVDEFRFLTGLSAFTTDAAITVPTLPYDSAGVRVYVSDTTVVTDNLVLVGDGTGRFAPGRAPRLKYVQFVLGEGVSNTSKYFYAERGLGGTQDDAQRSNSGNGMGFGSACSPVLAPFNGRITGAMLVVQGVGVNNGTATYPVQYRTDLYRSGFSTEHDANINSGTPVTLNFPIPSTNTVGIYSVGATNAKIDLRDLNILVGNGDMLALKFVNGSGASQAAMSQMSFVVLTIEETFA